MSRLDRASKILGVLELGFRVVSTAVGVAASTHDLHNRLHNPKAGTDQCACDCCEKRKREDKKS